MSLRLSSKSGISMLELILYLLVLGMIMSLLIIFLWRTRRMQEQQTIEMVYQGFFIKLRNQLEKDLTGCSKTPQIKDGATSLIIDRVDVTGQITYEVSLEKGEVIRIQNGSPMKFTFRGEREGVLKKIAFSQRPDRASSMNLKIVLNTTPPIELDHEFSVLVKASENRETGYFEVPNLDSR